jgi:hypothetical protein
MRNYLQSRRSSAGPLCGREPARLATPKRDIGSTCRHFPAHLDVLCLRFPQTTCISGWVMMQGRPAVIEDVYQDPRIPIEAYRPTFVRSLAIGARNTGRIVVKWIRKPDLGVTIEEIRTTYSDGGEILFKR